MLPHIIQSTIYITVCQIQFAYKLSYAVVNTKLNNKFLPTSKFSFGRQRISRRRVFSLKNSWVSWAHASGTGSASLLP